MLGARECELFATMDTSRQVNILRQTQTLDTDASDRLLGHLAGMHPARYDALRSALNRLDLG